MSLRPFPCVVVLSPCTAEKTLTIKGSQLYLAEGCGQKRGYLFILSHCFELVTLGEILNYWRPRQIINGHSELIQVAIVLWI